MMSENTDLLVDEADDGEFEGFESIELTFRAHVEVFDREALYKAAVERAQQEGTHDSESLKTMLGTAEDPNVEGCVIMLMDPGQSPPGMQIEQSFCDRD